MRGMTLKQWYKTQFYAALEEYKDALKSGPSKRLITASVRIHAAKGYVPKRLWSLVTRAYKEGMRV